MHAQADMEQAPKSKRDYTETMQQCTDPRLTQLEDLELHGYILKKTRRGKNTPTCCLICKGI